MNEIQPENGGIHPGKWRHSHECPWEWSAPAGLKWLPTKSRCSSDGRQGSASASGPAPKGPQYVSASVKTRRLVRRAIAGARRPTPSLPKVALLLLVEVKESCVRVVSSARGGAMICADRDLSQVSELGNELGNDNMFGR